MKLNKRKLLKSLLSIFVVSVFPVLIIVSLALYNDVGRNFIFNQIVSFLQSDNFSLKIEGANRELSYIDKIKVRFSNFSIDVSHLNLKREKSIFYPQLKAEEIVLKSLSAEKNSFSGFDLKKIPSVLKKTRFFIRNLKISKVILKVGDERHICEDVTYQSKKYQDVISAKIKQSDVNIAVNRVKSYRVKGDFENIFGYSINFQIDSLKKSKPAYQLIVKNSEQEFTARGLIIDEGKIFSISKALLKYKDIKLNFCGKVLLDNKQVNLATKLSLADFIDTRKIPSEIVKNFTNISANLMIEKKREEFDAKIDFEKDHRKIGNSRIKFKDRFLSVQSDVSWVNLWEYKINNLNIKSNDLKKFVVDVIGQDFKGNSEIVYDKEVIVKSLDFDVEKGKLSLKKAFFMSDFDPLFEFNFENLSFFKKICKLDGSATGELSFSDKRCWISAKTSKIIYKNCGLYTGKVLGDLNDLKIDVADVRWLGNTLKNLTFTKKNNELSLKTKLNDKSDVILDGNYSDNVLKIFGNIKNKNSLLKIINIGADSSKKLYNVSFEVRDKNKSGKFLLSVSPDKIDSTIENLPIQGIGKVLNKIFPLCFVNGSFSLIPDQNLFLGNGHLKIDGVVSKRSSFDIDLTQDRKGIYIQGDLTNSTDHLQFSTLIPIFINRSLGYSIKSDFPLAMVAKGEIHIENFFEFSDGVNIRGKIKSDFNVGGSFAFPEISGTLEYDKASIVISDVVLRNGVIKLRGQKNKFLVDDASFTDFRGKKARITGDIVLSFSDDIINLNSDLILNFDRFCLFKTDTTKIYITGTGNMHGPLNDMKLSGNLKIPLCELTFSETENVRKYEDIQFVNDRFLKKTKKQKNDFFLYDVGLECPKIKVVGNIYDLEFGGNLHLGSYNQKATLSGNVELKKGKLSLFGKRMIFDKSRVEFFENYPFNPKMNLICSRRLDNIEVFLKVTNVPGKEISIDLYSKPHYTQDIILSQMMFGKSSRYLSAMEAAQLAHALSSLEQKGYIFSILNAFQGIGLVDSISFSTGNNSSSLYKNSQSSSNNQLDVKVGKYLSDDVYISVNQREKETSFDVDLSIGSNTSLKVNTQGEVGISWKFRY